MDKAYKILALKENISNKEAKKLLDNAIVYSKDKRIRASDIISPNMPLKILQTDEIRELFRDDKILAISKPSFVDSFILEKKFRDWVLLNRLDKVTSGVILLVKKDSNFRNFAIEEFKKNRVYKEYLALVNGILAEEITINKPISTLKNHFARSKIDFKSGKSAITHISPLKIYGKKTLLKIVIQTGRTHQIRVHLSSINYPIVGDSLYGGVEFRRLMLHSYKIKIFDYEFCAKEGDFWKYIQN
ncbi:MAG: RNA pseudouridine synthase [Helicobacteraceae bacterium]|nr:RNA pseudouridine synthase [Helicobacteraceae bacterium]